ncbi:hypothetical protein [Leptospira interrogans]|nr:hypothetical protein [Leptospira interrogans]
MKVNKINSSLKRRVCIKLEKIVFIDKVIFMKEIKTKRFDGGRVPLASDALYEFIRNRPKTYLLTPNYLKRVLRYPLAGKYFCVLPGPGFTEISGSSHILQWNLNKVVVPTFYERSLISATQRNNANAYVCLALYGSLISATQRNNANAYVCLALYGSLDI